MFEIFEHTADLGLRVQAETLPQLFDDAARGLFSMLVVNQNAVQKVHERTYHITGEQPDYLLFDWLSELLYTFETEQMLFCDFKVEIDDSNELCAVCRGEPMDLDRHEMDHEVKAVTYHHLTVQQEASGGWLAEVIVDI